MKKFTFISAGLALLASAAFTSCEKSPAPSADEGTKSIALSINFGGVGTKANVDGEVENPWEGNDFDEFNSLDIFFTSGNDNIVYYYHAEDETSGNSQTIWDGLTASTNNGVRFVGMEGISKVYVAANAPDLTETITTDDYGKVSGTVTMSAINALLKITDYTGEQNVMLYAGATSGLVPVSTTSTTNEVEVGERGGQDYQAVITIRPAVSRFEISKAGVKTAGTVYFAASATTGEMEEVADENDAEYKVEYTGFNPDLVGVHMSNFYYGSNLFTTNANLGEWTIFETPDYSENASPIQKGTWTALNADASLQGFASYANYDEGTSSYGPIVSDTYSGTSDDTDNTVTFKFDGSKNSANKVIPFNVFVPYDITNATNGAISAIDETKTPVLHLQFKKPASYTAKVYKNLAEPGNPAQWDTNECTDNVATYLSADFTWPTSGTNGDLAFANVVKFYENDGLTTEATFKPGYIYKIEKIVVDPTNISISTTSTDAYNVFVVVTVVGYQDENVYPGFE